MSNIRKSQPSQECLTACRNFAILLLCHPSASLDPAFFLTIPRVSLHIGATPVMPGSSVEDGLKRYYGVAPTATGEEAKKCGKNGSYMEVTNNGLKHIGLILVEDMGMKIVHFFDCQAPGNEFDEQLETFRKILDSVECK